MKPQYKTWIRLRKMLIFITIFSCIFTSLFFFDNSTIKILLLLISIPFGYISIILLLSYFYFSEHGGNYQNIIHDKLVNKINIDDNISVVDIGAGSGSLSIKTAKKNKSLKVTSVDYWGDNWEYSMKQCLANTKIEFVDQQIDLIKASASKLPFADNDFDVVISCLTFHEVQDVKDKNLVIAEAIRVLKSGGQFVFFDLFYEKNDFGDIGDFVEKLESNNVKIIEMTGVKDFLVHCPKILLKKKVLGQGLLIVGKKV